MWQHAHSIGAIEALPEMLAFRNSISASDAVIAAPPTANVAVRKYTRSSDGDEITPTPLMVLFRNAYRVNTGALGVRPAPCKVAWINVGIYLFKFLRLQAYSTQIQE